MKRKSETKQKYELNPCTGPDGYIDSLTKEEPVSILTVKGTAKNPKTLAKVLAVLKSQYKPLTSSRMLFNPDTHEYYQYVNFSCQEIERKLQEVTSFP